MIKEYMMWRGEPVTSKTPRKTLLEIISYLASELTETQVRASKYLQAADPTKLTTLNITKGKKS